MRTPFSLAGVAMLLAALCACRGDDEDGPAAAPLVTKGAGPRSPAPPKPPELAPAADDESASGLPRLRVEVVRIYPHDTAAYTQGLLMVNGRLFESTGRRGTSSLREVDLASGAVMRKHDLSNRYFGEGIAAVGSRVFMLTWKRRTAFVFDLETFRELGSYSYDGQGWGLAFDGTRLIMSDGTSSLRFIEPDSFVLDSAIEVRRDGEPADQLNELEFVDGFIYANVWTVEEILKIAPVSGDVVAVIDASGLLAPHERARADVLNGIAHDVRSGHFLLTGKFWPKLFEVRFVE